MLMLELIVIIIGCLGIVGVVMGVMTIFRFIQYIILQIQKGFKYMLTHIWINVLIVICIGTFTVAHTMKISDSKHITFLNKECYYEGEKFLGVPNGYGKLLEKQSGNLLCEAHFEYGNITEGSIYDQHKKIYRGVLTGEEGKGTIINFEAYKKIVPQSADSIVLIANHKNLTYEGDMKDNLPYQEGTLSIGNSNMPIRFTDTTIQIDDETYLDDFKRYVDEIFYGGSIFLNGQRAYGLLEVLYVLHNDYHLSEADMKCVSKDTEVIDVSDNGELLMGKSGDTDLTFYKGDESYTLNVSLSSDFCYLKVNRNHSYINDANVNVYGIGDYRENMDYSDSYDDSNYDYSEEYDAYDDNIHHVDPHQVDGYYRDDGTYVDGYWRGGDDGYYRSDPDGYEYNNLNP